MNIKSLERLDTHTAAGILANIALASNNPGVGIALEHADIAKGQEGIVLREIREKLEVAQDDKSPAAIARVLVVVSEALSNLVLEGKDPKEIADRAGQHGRLPVSMYQLELVPGFMKNFREFGVREQHVRDDIRSADAYRHLMTGEAYADSDAFSLFLKWHERKGEDEYCSIAMANRIGKRLIAQHLWRVYPDDVNLSDFSDPERVLAAFCEVYGLDVVLGDQKSKFIARHRIPMSAPGVMSFAWKVEQSHIRHLTTASGRVLADKRSMDVGLVFAIDLEKYKASLRRHGVHL